MTPNFETDRSRLMHVYERGFYWEYNNYYFKAVQMPYINLIKIGRQLS